MQQFGRYFIRKSLLGEYYADYLFLSQEKITTNGVFINQTTNTIGSAILPIINKMTSLLQTFQYSDSSFETGTGFSPGMEHCSWDPHAKWHLQSSIALTDFIFLADQIHGILSRKNTSTTAAIMEP